MVRLSLRKSRIVTQLVVLAALTTVVTIAVGMGTYFASVAWRHDQVMAQMPPEARAEIQHLIDTDQRDTDRFLILYNSYRVGRDSSEYPYLVRYITIIATAVGGAVVGGAVAFLLARRISRPIVAVANAAAQFSAGDRAVRVAKGNKSGEVGTLIESFNAMAAEIELYERERTILTAGIAHELRTPLTILKGRLHALADGVIDPASGEADRLLRQVSHLSHLVEDLRILSHADAGELLVERREVHLDEIMRAVVADLRSTADAEGVTLNGRYTPARVFGDPMRLTQILMNLLTNAIKHSPRESTVNISMAHEGNNVRIDVVDEGEGFAPGEKPQLFIPFWRGTKDTSLGRPGSGLGLTLAAKFAEAHDGQISGAARVDQSGAHFTLSLPFLR